MRQFHAFLARMSFLLLSVTGSAHAQSLTQDLEVYLVPTVGATWKQVTLENTYSDPVVVCTYNLASKLNPSVTTRIQNVSSNSFQVRIQQFENSNTVTPGDVHCIISEAGTYDLPNGLKYEAHTVLSDNTSGLSVTSGWKMVNTEEVTGSIGQSYANPVVLGQVMTFNDAKASVFWTNNCVTRGRTPFNVTGRICVGKHIGQINGTRLNETIGYIVAEAGSGNLNDMAYELALGSDKVAGTGNTPAYNYSVTGNYDIGITSQNGEDGGQGGWSVLYGADPLPSNAIGNAIEEETFAGDTTRTHTTEQVSYWVFEDNQVANVDAEKSVAVSSLNPTPYATPGSDLLYTIEVENTGSKSVDEDTIFLSDTIPSEVVFHIGDIDGAGPETGSIIFQSTGSGLTFTEATDLGFSSAATKPVSFADCTYTPSAGYDPNIKHVCFAPKGRLNSGSFGASTISLTFRVRIL